jgi:serine/threonine protein kinase
MSPSTDSTLRRAAAFHEEWEYRLGSSPRLKNGDWQWAQPDLQDGGWQQPSPKGQAPMRTNQPEIWIRVRLAGPLLSSPTLSLRLIGLNPEVYLQGQRQSLQALPHHPWEEQHSHERRFLLHLPADYSGKMMSIHLFAKNQRIGVLEPVYLGEPAAVMMALLQDAAPVLVQGIVMAFLACLAFVLFLANRKDLALIYFSLICLSASAFWFGITGMLSLLSDWAFPSTILVTLAGPVVGISAYSFLQEVLGSARWRFLRWSRNALLVGFCIELIVLFYDVSLLVHLGRPMIFLLMLTVGVIVFVPALAARQGHQDGKIICVGIALAGLLALPDMLTLSGLWARPTRFLLMQGTSDIFLLSLALVLIRRYMAVHQQLGKYSGMLSEQVRTLERRNLEIQNLNDELRRQIEQRSDRMIEILSRSRQDLRPAAEPSLEPGGLLGEHYRVIRALGQGAMGCVYEVERSSDGLRLAAKLMTAKAGRSAVIRFIREARILAQLTHPNLVGIKDIDISLEGNLFLVMELVSGTTLKAAKRRYREPGFAPTVLRQICLGLQAIHAQGVIHRDLKPANILLTEESGGLMVKIADFGVSTLRTNPVETPSQGSFLPQRKSLSGVLPKANEPLLPSEEEPAEPTIDVRVGEEQLADEAELPGPAPADGDALADAQTLGLGDPAQLTQTGVVLGTPLYVAPELAAGSRLAPPASDIFSLGVIAFELLTGRLPFIVPPVFAQWKGQSTAMMRLSELRPDLPPERAILWERCLDSDPASRPTLSELIAAIPT